MKSSNFRAVAVLTALAMFAFSGLAFAAENDDTVFNFGYDPNSQFFMWNVTALEYETPAEESEGDGMDLEALFEACGLETPDEPTSYGYTFDGETISLFELDEEGNFDPEGEPTDLGDCGSMNGGFVAGPNGQVNHGVFLKLFNSMYDGPNRGCLVSQIAKSGLGKGDQKVKPGDVDTEDEAEEPATTVEDGRVTFTTATATCNRGPSTKGDGDDEDEENEGQRGGPPQHVLDKFGGEHPGKGASKNQN